ncbi:FAD-dependent oxidoreductase [Bacillus sp. CDB3]|uniref:FAD-dependent oxidoreductase n=1 Tax=Bacillus sp. CDB3 TaxID=360310 RepID=UPI0009D8BF07|nr:FAD-dependent oxidoreductase [Bacillus sp. CDB3]OQR53291.1 NADH oxidase [Bacillus sp. CDB3]
MKVAVIGCTHAGTAAVTNIAKLHPEAQITVYEKNDNVSFLSCGIALFVGGVVDDARKMFYSSPEQLTELGVKMNIRHEVLEINAEAKTLRARNLVTNEEKEDIFDKLIMTTGSWPIIPRLEGMELDNIVMCKNYAHANTIIEKAKHAHNIVVIGAGYIGIELVEAFETSGKKVTLIDSANRILNKYLDAEFTNVTEQAFEEKGVKLALGQTVTKFEGENGKVKQVITTKGAYGADLVILCIGFRPNTDLLQGQVEMLPNGAIVVNEYMQTRKPYIFAAGDNCATLYNPTGKHEYIPLATNAVRMGTLVARNLVKPSIRYMGTQGTSGIKIYNYNIASTGLTETAAESMGMNVKSSTITDNYRPEFMPTSELVTVKVVYEIETRRIIGAQVMSKADLTQSVNTLSICIQNQMTIDQLAFVDFFFQPHYNKPWNFLNRVGLHDL